MNNLLDTQKIVQENGDLIHLVIMSVFEPGYQPQLENILAQAENNGWESLVGAIRTLLSGERDIAKFQGLDQEDQAIITSILEGIDDPASLPELTYAVNPVSAGPAIAGLIYAAGKGNEESIKKLDDMTSQFAACGGDLSHIASITGILISGERDKDALSVILGGSGMGLLDEILKELARLEA